jgi:ABC-type sugar transport system ATPase subunit
MCLQVENISKHYAGVHALKQASFEAREGEVHALMGENGAGKSTLAKIIAGSVQPDEGTIRVDGKEVRIPSPLAAQRHGIGIIYQELDLFPNLTVGENIVIANLEFDEHRFVNRERIEKFCGPFLDLVGLDCGPDVFVADLPIGRQQLVAIARAVSMNARVIIMDEPTSSLFDDAAERLFRLIAHLKDKGVSVVYVSHKMDEIFRICDRITILRDGRTVATLNTAEASVPEVIRFMVGRDLVVTQRQAVARGEVILQVRRLTTNEIKDVSFDLHRGEVFGIAGLVGAGRSELGAALFGLEKKSAGTIDIAGKPALARSPLEAMKHGIGLLPENRKAEGLMMQMTVLENSTMSVLKRLSRAGFIQGSEEMRAVDPLFRQLALRTSSVAAPVSTLSGGNQQKVLLARCLLGNPEVLFLDDPARGIDVSAKQDIYRIIRALAANGKGVILVSSELPELLHCCDRIMVMREGRVTAMFDAAEATQEAIMTAATVEAA